VSDTTRSRLKVSREGIVLIKSFEGFRPRAVQDEAGRWLIGYGHSASAREGLTVGEQDAELLLQYDLLPVVKALNEDVSAALNQHQFDALASFAISVGIECFLSSDVLQLLNAGFAGEAADALIGWPETMSRDAALRRRAAERALFVADPAGPVLLADLLAAPLPPPPIRDVEADIIRPDFTADARAAAVASLLGEEPPEPPATETADSTAVEVEANPMGLSASPSRSMPSANIAAMRYAPYSAAIIGPLPGFPPATASPMAAPVAADASTPGTADSESGEEPESEPPSPTDAVEAAPAFETVSASAVEPLVSAPPVTSPFAPLDEPLVLTPAAELDFVESARPVWPQQQRFDASPDSPLFDEEPTLSVLRHEAEPVQPRRFDWSETGAFLIMGGVGLAACAASAAAFRLAVTEPSDMGETTVIAWALALIGAICVGVSSWNLYVRWGRSS